MTKTFNELLESVNVGDTVTGFLKADLKTILHQELQKAREEERKKARNLYQGLQMMFDQYCPKGDHQFMTAGETAEELLNMYTDLRCDCEEATEQQEWDGHTRYCKALNQSELDQPTH